MEQKVRKVSLIVPVLAMSTLLSACQSVDFEALAVGIAQGIGESAGQYPTVYTPASNPSTSAPRSPPVYTDSDGSYVDRMVNQSNQRLLSTAPCDPAALAQWRAMVRQNLQGVQDLSFINRTPPHCRN